MLSQISVTGMEELLRREHPNWSDAALKSLAWRYVDTLDPRLEAPLARYAATGSRTELEAGEFTLFAICALCQCGYVDAVILMDGYLKDPIQGKAQILRR